MAKAVFCIAQNWVQTEDIVDRLKMAGFACRDISVLIGEKTGTREFAMGTASMGDSKPLSVNSFPLQDNCFTYAIPILVSFICISPTYSD
jgi:hypothetical protein